MVTAVGVLTVTEGVAAAPRQVPAVPVRGAMPVMAAILEPSDRVAAVLAVQATVVVVG